MSEKRGGYRPNAGRGSIIPLSEAEKIQSLADEGWNYHRLALRYQVSWSAMRRFFVRNGLTYGIGHDGKLITDRPTKPVAAGEEAALYAGRTYEDASRLELRLERAFEIQERARTRTTVNVAALGDPAFRVTREPPPELRKEPFHCEGRDA